MSDIFISYSRKDSEQALVHAERLQARGISVWIDQRGIEAARVALRSRGERRLI